MHDRIARYVWDKPTHSENETLDTLRTLAQYQDDVSAFDLNCVTVFYDGPPEGMDILLTHSSLHFERFDIVESVDSLHPLVIALWCYSWTFFSKSCLGLENFSSAHQATFPQRHKQWEPLIKRFIKKGADLHVPVPRFDPSSHFPFLASEYGTPLDVLFQFSETPDEASTLGAEWLGFIAAEGHDVVAYLRKEMTLHAPEHHMTRPLLSDTPSSSAMRELKFIFDDAGPCVWWEWWIDPASHIDLLEREFKQMVKHTCMAPVYLVSFLIDTWPIQYPVWYDNSEKLERDWLEEGMKPDERRRRAHLAMQRANRRLERRHDKNAYSKRLRHSKMPGAWPVSSWD